MNLKHWLDHLLPPAVTRSWALAAGCPDEAQEQGKVLKPGAAEVHSALGAKAQNQEVLPFDDVQ